MRISSLLVVLTVFVVLTVATPSGAIHTIEAFDGETNGRFLVTLKPNVRKGGVISQLGRNSSITNHWDIINGFAGILDEATVNILRKNIDVESIAEDGIMHALNTQ